MKDLAIYLWFRGYVQGNELSKDLFEMLDIATAAIEIIAFTKK